MSKVLSKEKLAIDGGTPVITEGIPGGMHGPSSILSRALRFGSNVNMREEHARLMAAAINKVDAALGG